MLAKLTHALPVGEGWSFEVKWDGVRCLAYVSGGRFRLESRNRLDISAQYPELRELGESLGSLEVVLDGEIVAFNAEGRPSFERLQQRLGLKGEAARRRSREIPAIYIVFDLLFLDGHPTTTLPFRDRRAVLEQLNLQGAAWRTATVHDDGESLLAATKEHGLEGVIAKRVDSSYEAGRRTGAWLKVKNHLHQPFIVCGWMQRDNATVDTIGALVLGYYNDEKQLHYAGRVGTGFTEESAARLMRQLLPLRRPSSPFASPIPERPSAFTEPRVVVDVEFLEWTEEGMLRQPSFKGVRADCAPGDVVRESD